MAERQEKIISRISSETSLVSGYLTYVGIADIDAVLDLATKAYPQKILPGVIESLTFNKSCLQTGLDNGRKLFKREEDGRIVGVCGIQRKSEDPPGICWGSWFFIDPEKRGSTLAFRMGAALLATTKKLGYKTIYVDTTTNRSDYYNISPYLLKTGFALVGSIPDFYEHGVDMQFYSLNL